MLPHMTNEAPSGVPQNMTIDRIQEQDGGESDTIDLHHLTAAEDRVTEESDLVVGMRAHADEDTDVKHPNIYMRRRP